MCSYACFADESRGRAREEAPCPYRTCFQRDRDRVLHSKAFRRLKQKTQVFLSPEGDHYRTRLTHTLEVSQIARTIARALQLNEDLTEAIAMGHDLGHTPFGHAGERALDKLCPGGFRHYEQSVRVAEKLERAGKGLNLSKETLPETVRLKYGLAEYNFAMRGIHFPEDKQVFYQARERLVFEEFLEFILALRKLRDKNERFGNDYVIPASPRVEEFIKELPYELTGAQKKVWKEISADMASDTVMSRLVQGDVGSGKTIVAFLALLTVALNGMQAAMMAPTEVLARQHYATITRMLEEHQIPVKAELLTGSMTTKEKRRAYDRIECGYAKIIVGTHALIQDAVNYDNLALVVTDEQHRFGVKQRETFAKKGGVPHVLVMSATPIPRTLAIILYGDLDISVIDELPANRLPIKNCVVDTGYRATAYTFMKKQIGEGRQCYIICPMVEESESLEAENVLDYSSMLQEEMGEGIVVSCLHGRMKQAEKDEIMERFARAEKSRTSEGNGLGLSIADSFTKNCGGEFSIRIDGDQFLVTIQFKQHLDVNK